MEHMIKTTFRWWKDNGKTISKAHRPYLEETAKERIADLIKQGFTSGELHDNLNGVDYSGWFEITTEVLA